MKTYSLNRLVIKPTLRCNANCFGCTSRRELHRSLKKERQLSLEQWKTILQEAASLGLKYLHISGGEPTLYPQLMDLIKEGKRLDLRVRINSNGSRITRKLATELLEAGLDEICISIYSHDPQIHNKSCGNKNLWQQAVEAVRIFSELKDRYPGFFLTTMSIILRENYRSLDELVEFHHRLGSQQIGLSYLEGDFSNQYLLTKEEILEIRENVVPKLVKYCKTLDPRVRSRAVNTAMGIYGPALGNPDDSGKGIYWTKNYCNVPRTAGLIMANGDVHPCNIVEYTHEPVVGNLFKNSVRDIWNSVAWGRFRQSLHEKCAFCPVNVYMTIPLAQNPETSALESLYHSKVFSPFRLATVYLKDFYREQKHKIYP